MTYKYALPTMSLGRAWVHDLPTKLKQAASHNFTGIEIFYEDLEYHAKAKTGGLTDSNLLSAAQEIGTLCADLHLEIIALQPFMFYEGLTDRTEHSSRIQELHLWFQLIKLLNTTTIQIPSNFLIEGITGDREVIVADLREVADLGAKEFPPVRFVYEALCWGKHVNTWEHSWDIVKVVDRPNFGICLDTFHIAGGVYADPSREDGRVPGGEKALRESMRRLKRDVDVEKVFYVQVVDGERLEKPIEPGHEYFIEDQDTRMGWSRNARVFPFEDRGYMPILEVLEAITGDEGLGYKGWISFELFSRTMNEAGDEVPAEHAARAAVSREKLAEAMKWS